MVVGGPGQHLDVGTGAEHLVEAARHHDGPNLGMFEAQPLDGVGELDVNGQIVGVELEAVVVPQAAIGVDQHGEGGQWRADVQAPVPVGVRVAVEGHSVGRSHGVPLVEYEGYSTIPLPGVKSL